MSIYSGFGTRKMEQNYNSLLSRLILLLQEQVLQFLPLIQYGELTQSQKYSMPSQKSHKYMYILTKMKQYEQHKYLEPKFSQLCTPLKKYFQNDSLIQHNDNPHEQVCNKTETPESPIRLMQNDNVTNDNKKLNVTQSSLLKKTQNLVILGSPNKKRGKKMHSSPYKRSSSSNNVKTQTQLSIYKKYNQKFSDQRKDSENYNIQSASIKIYCSNPGTNVSRYRYHWNHNKQPIQAQKYFQSSKRIFHRSNMTSKAQNQKDKADFKSMNNSLLQKSFNNKCDVVSDEKPISSNIIPEQFPALSNNFIQTNFKTDTSKNVLTKNRTHFKQSFKEQIFKHYQKQKDLTFEQSF